MSSDTRIKRINFLKDTIKDPHQRPNSDELSGSRIILSNFAVDRRLFVSFPFFCSPPPIFFFFLTADSTRNIVRPAIKFRGAGLIKRDAHTGRWGVGRTVARGFYIFLLGVVTFFKRRGYHRGTI